MYRLSFHQRPDSTCPYDEYVQEVYRSGRKGEAAKIRAYIERLREMGSQPLVVQGWAEKMNDVWQLRPGRHRVFYYWNSVGQEYVILNAYQKATRRTPPGEIDHAERLRDQHNGN